MRATEEKQEEEFRYDVFLVDLKHNKRMFSQRYKMPHAAEERRKALESSYKHLGYRGTIERVSAETPEPVV